MQELGINISAKKSEVIVSGSGTSDVRVVNVQLRGKAMKTVKDFTYLDGVAASNGMLKRILRRRVFIKF